MYHPQEGELVWKLCWYWCLQLFARPPSGRGTFATCHLCAVLGLQTLPSSCFGQQRSTGRPAVLSGWSPWSVEIGGKVHFPNLMGSPWYIQIEVMSGVQLRLFTLTIGFIYSNEEKDSLVSTIRPRIKLLHLHLLGKLSQQGKPSLVWAVIQ